MQEATERGVKKINNFINLRSKANWEKKWFLAFKCNKDMKLLKNPIMKWIWVEDVVKVHDTPGNSLAFDKENPYQAVQFKKLSPYCLPPPFDCSSKEFIEAFRSAIEELGAKYFEDSPNKHNYRPANKLLNLIEKKMKGC